MLERDKRRNERRHWASRYARKHYQEKLDREAQEAKEENDKPSS